MRLTDENKQKITDRIREGAAAEFREKGYDKVNIDQIMKRAGLTRGAFYAHYRSKSDLFADVMRQEHPLLAMLRRRPGPDGSDLRAQMQVIFGGYLGWDNLEWVFNGCSLASLTGEVTRASDGVKAAFEAVFQEVLEDMARGQPAPPEAYTPVLVLAAGAVRSARAMVSTEQQKATLRAAHDAVQSMIETLGEGGPNDA